MQMPKQTAFSYACVKLSILYIHTPKGGKTKGMHVHTHTHTWCVFIDSHRSTQGRYEDLQQWFSLLCSCSSILAEPCESLSLYLIFQLFSLTVSAACLHRETSPVLLFMTQNERTNTMSQADFWESDPAGHLISLFSPLSCIQTLFLHSQSIRF